MVAEIINFSLNWPDFGVGGVKISKKKIKVLELSEKARYAIKIICCRCVFSIGRGNYLSKECPQILDHWDPYFSLVCVGVLCSADVKDQENFSQTINVVQST